MCFTHSLKLNGVNEKTLCTYSCLGSYRRSDDFDILEGDLQGLSDTAQFLRTLAFLDEVGDVRASDLAEVPQRRELLAAGGLFRWEVFSRLW